MSTTNSQTARVLVTGASGNNGHRLVRELNDDRGPEDVTVVAAVRNELKAEGFAAQGIETVIVDLDDVDSVRAAVASRHGFSSKRQCDSASADRSELHDPAS
jgi:nucleoside-diphosphate-sugar epimerase